MSKSSSPDTTTEAQKPKLFSSHDFMEFLKGKCDDISELTVLTKSGTVVSASFDGANNLDLNGIKSSEWSKSFESHASSKSSENGATTSAALAKALTSRDWVDDYKSSHVEVTYSQSFSNNPAQTASQQLPRIPSPTLPLKKRTDWKAMYEDALAPKQHQQQQAQEPKPEKSDWYSSTSIEPLSSLVEAASRATPQPVSDPPIQSSDTSTQMSDDKKTSKQTKQTKRKSRKIIPEDKEYIDEYTDTDVLFGRGGRSNHHPGNKFYRKKVTDMQPHYRSCDKNEKTMVAQSIVDLVHELGGRFLELDKAANRWYIVPNIVARRKVGQALREINTEEARAAKREKYGPCKQARNYLGTI